MTKALVVIDIQNDYFAGGRFPLWNAEATLAAAERAIAAARAHGIPVILVQHIAASDRAPFFVRGSDGAALHPAIAAAAPGAPIVVKQQADSFRDTTLAATLDQLGARELIVCGMMTQNCVTHTAISKTAEAYDITVLGDVCTTVSEPIHLIALSALSPRVRVTTTAEAL